VKGRRVRGCGGAPAGDGGRGTGPRPSTARRAARSVVVPVPRASDDRATGGYVRRRRRRLDPIETNSATHACDAV
jgi:hypothetical protein